MKRLAVIALTLALGGCGGSDSKPAATKPADDAVNHPAPVPKLKAGSGESLLGCLKNIPGATAERRAADLLRVFDQVHGGLVLVHIFPSSREARRYAKQLVVSSTTRGRVVAITSGVKGSVKTNVDTCVLTTRP